VADFTQTLLGALVSSVALLLQAPLLLFGALPAVQSVVRSWSLYCSAGVTSLLTLLASFRWSAARQLIARGWPLMLSSFAIMIYMKSDIVMLQWMGSSEEVGQYSVAVRVAESLYFLPVVLSQTYLPRLSSGTCNLIDQPDPAKWRQLCQLSYILGLVMAIGTLIILSKFLVLVFGDQFKSSVIALQFLAPAAIAVAAGCTSGVLLNLQDKRRILALRTAIGAVVNIFLNLILIPRYGIAGAAAATSISQFIAVFALGLLEDETRQSHFVLLQPWR
jgi:O-antigen/teichoic acid export membrane protein